MSETKVELANRMAQVFLETEWDYKEELLEKLQSVNSFIKMEHLKEDNIELIASVFEYWYYINHTKKEIIADIRFYLGVNNGL